ncbi:ABC transporter permease [Thermomonospora cellulosilytica]|uniref:Peptide/nickel transport system permease protein n=1 Tax=Thermomonospora cellulosilytica TaxID=1411118 RepID=A0A7W3N1Z0_9ACTN|nr:ABC transporter permease [Thermomonospora cellulosilytica]MBA9006054.1 peptide/nickel transport system permease protein [Thermomonospora cellulosilytica]
MIAFVVRRLVAAVALLVVVTMVTFAIFFLVPRLAGATPDDLASRYVGRDATPTAVQAAKKRLHLDDPVPVQYGRFVKSLVAGDTFDYGPTTVKCPAPCFGYSFRNSQNVLDLIKDRFPVTFSLALGASVFWLVTGVLIGVLSALRRGSLFDRAAMAIALAGVSLPIYFTGLITLSLLVYRWELWPEPQYVGLLENPALWAQNLLLPWITLAFLYAAMYARLTRSGMLETLNEDFIRTARAKGLPERTVITKHALRATLTPILTIFGLDFGLLLGGAVLTETTFNLKGLGELVVNAIRGNDLPVVLGVVMFTAIFVVVANLIVDVLYAVVDPRVRLG